MMEFVSMGKYGAYVWSCFGLTVLIFLLIEWRTRARHRKIYRDVVMRIRATEENS